MHVVKWYQCPIYKTVKYKIYRVNAKGLVLDQSPSFKAEWLDSYLAAHKVKKPIYIKTASMSTIEQFENPPHESL